MRSTEQTEIFIGAKLICIALGLYEGGKVYFREPWIACFIPVNCQCNHLGFYSSWNVIFVIAVSTGRPPSVSGGRCWLKSEQRSFVIYRRNTHVAKCRLFSQTGRPTAVGSVSVRLGVSPFSSVSFQRLGAGSGAQEVSKHAILAIFRFLCGLVSHKKCWPATFKRNLQLLLFPPKF